MKNEQKQKQERIRLLSFLSAIAKKAGITHQDLAERTGFVSNNVSRMLQGRYTPTLDNFIRLAEAVNYEVALVPKRKTDGERRTEDKFLLSVDSKEKKLYILHRNYPSCLVEVVQEIPVHLVIVQEVYDQMDDYNEIYGMPFVEELKEFYRQITAESQDLN